VSKTRKLFQIRHHPNDGACSGRQVGHKARLVPRYCAQRIASRLRRSGAFITIDPIIVNVRPAQAAYLDHRYP
jgi:hypothetical protein